MMVSENSRPLRSALVAAAFGLGALCTPVVAQQSEESDAPTTRDVAQLNAALQRLARNPQSVSALVDAGTASLELGDIDAAIGFFGRADELSPGNPQAKLGMAAGFLRSERPIEALRLFAEAEEAGVSSERLAGDRGLAFDLVGDNERAQQQYQIALRQTRSARIIRRLALSQAISGNRDDFEQTLLPLLQQRDLAAYRTRAFGLAILGQHDEALRIVEAVMPQSMASRISPYLRFMPQLTKAQQAAAANLGRFPRTGEIGQTSAQIAQSAAAGSQATSQAEASLTPQGAPLGQQADSETAPTTRIASRPVTQDVPARLPQTNASPGSQLERVISEQSVPEGAKVVSGVSVSEAFATLDNAKAPSSDGSAVDITTIEPRREVAAPVHPQRHWVQVATGQDLTALKFDWRRLARRAPEVLGELTPHTVPWGQANRLLAGPFGSAAEAQNTVNLLKQNGINTFSYTSPAGQAIRELD